MGLLVYDTTVGMLGWLLILACCWLRPTDGECVLDRTVRLAQLLRDVYTRRDAMFCLLIAVVTGAPEYSCVCVCVR